MILNIIRNGLGQALILGDRLTRPKPIERPAEDQKRIESELSKFAIYEYNACPFCIKTRRSLHKLNLPITLKDAKKQPFRQELEVEGGKIQVPCLKISEDNGKTRWLYESSDIITYLETLYG